MRLALAVRLRARRNASTPDRSTMTDQFPHPSELAELTAAINSLADHVRRLDDRVAALERSPAKRPPAQSPPVREALDQATVMVIAAAVAAFLGEKPPLHQIRLVSGPSWVQTGRATIQASHELPIRHN